MRRENSTMPTKSNSNKTISLVRQCNESTKNQKNNRLHSIESTSWMKMHAVVPKKKTLQLQIISARVLYVLRQFLYESESQCVETRTAEKDKNFFSFISFCSKEQKMHEPKTDTQKKNDMKLPNCYKLIQYWIPTCVLPFRERDQLKWEYWFHAGDSVGLFLFRLSSIS